MRAHNWEMSLKNILEIPFVTDTETVVPTKTIFSPTDLRALIFHGRFFKICLRALYDY